MTCIVGLAQGGKVFIGADGLATGTGGLASIHKYGKVFRAETEDKDEHFLIAVAGSPRVGQLMRYSFVAPDYEVEDNPHRYMSLDFIDRLRQVLYRTSEDKEEYKNNETCFLVGFRGRLFCVDASSIVENEDGYDAAGSDPGIALGVLHATRDMGLPPEKRIQMALEASEAHNAYVRRPFHIESI
jgi:ATP-dependent protease HslVU (ClpYQ) peptidase subunit